MAVIIPLIEPSQHAGLIVNQSKTKYMKTSRGKDKITEQYTVCNRRNGPDFGRVFLMLNYTDITQNTYIQG